MSLEAAEQAVRDGDLQTALRQLQDQIKQQPARAELRVFLFQLLSVLGQWERALTQLNVAADLDAKTLAMAQMYREAIKCEALRADVFAGKTSPVVFGQPEEWLALLIESMLVHGRARAAEAQSLRERAFESAPATTGYSTVRRSSGLPTPTCGSGRCARRSSTGATTGSPSSGWRESTSKRRWTCVTWCGCRRTSSSQMAAIRLASFRHATPGPRVPTDRKSVV